MGDRRKPRSGCAALCGRDTPEPVGVGTAVCADLALALAVRIPQPGSLCRASGLGGAWEALSPSSSLLHPKSLPLSLEDTSVWFTGLTQEEAQDPVGGMGPALRGCKWA